MQLKFIFNIIFITFLSHLYFVECKDNYRYVKVNDIYNLFTRIIPAFFKNDVPKFFKSDLTEYFSKLPKFLFKNVPEFVRDEIPNFLREYYPSFRIEWIKLKRFLKCDADWPWGNDNWWHICMTPFDEGDRCMPHRVKHNRWYYDYYVRNGCFYFRYKGCGGNENRFLTYKDCHDSCLIREKSGICALLHDEGRYCLNATVTMWYYSNRLKRCDRFEYGGCNSSSLNRFFTKAECVRACMGSDIYNPGKRRFNLNGSSCYENQRPDYNDYYLINGEEREKILIDNNFAKPLNDYGDYEMRAWKKSLEKSTEPAIRENVKEENYVEDTESFSKQQYNELIDIIQNYLMKLLTNTSKINDENKVIKKLRIEQMIQDLLFEENKRRKQKLLKERLESEDVATIPNDLMEKKYRDQFLIQVYNTMKMDKKYINNDDINILKMKNYFYVNATQKPFNIYGITTKKSKENIKFMNDVQNSSMYNKIRKTSSERIVNKNNMFVIIATRTPFFDYDVNNSRTDKPENYRTRARTIKKDFSQINNNQSSILIKQSNRKYNLTYLTSTAKNNNVYQNAKRRPFFIHGVTTNIKDKFQKNFQTTVRPSKKNAIRINIIRNRSENYKDNRLNRFITIKPPKKYKSEKVKQKSSRPKVIIYIPKSFLSMKNRKKREF